MRDHCDRPVSAYLDAPDSLLVLGPVAGGGGVDADLFIALEADGTVTAFNGHVDLGTGIRTALAQIVAEELDLPFDRVRMVLGTTSAVPNQGATFASETIQVTAIPLRAAAATARAHLLRLGAERFGLPAGRLRVEDGVIRADASNLVVSYRDLLVGQRIRLALDPGTRLKEAAGYRIVGHSQPRADVPAKAFGTWTYVHDVRVPGMLHGRVVRPPYAGFDSGDHVGKSLLAVDESSVSGVPGLVAVVAIEDFVGVVAEREENAIEAMRLLKTRWRQPPAIPDLNAPEAALRANTSRPRRLADRGDVDRALAGAAEVMTRSYVWPYQMHGSIGPSCAVADFGPEMLRVWSGTQNPYPMRADLALLLDLPEARIVVERLEAAGCYGRNCADDVTADAALLSRAVGRPVRVQLTREQEHAWEPKGAAQVMDVRGGLDAENGASAYAFETRYPSNAAATLALLLTGVIPATPITLEMGDRTAIPPYAYGNLRVTVHDMPPIARASWFRGVSALPNTFAHESFIDELATAAAVDPIEYRLRYLTDRRAIDLVKAVADRAAWVPRTQPGTSGRNGDILYGRGFAYAVYIHGGFPGTAAAWSAWAVDVAVNKATGEVAVTRVVAGQDTGQVINPAGVRHQIHGNVLQSTGRVLKEQVGFSATAVTSQDWGAYPILSFPEVPEVEVVMVPRPDDPPLGAGESASVPSAAAIANAVFDATGVRFRELPLTPERVRAALNPLPPPSPPPRKAALRRWLPFAGIAATCLAALTTALPWRPAIEPIPRQDGVFSAATIERGRLAAAAGACNVCHRGPDGAAFAGGRALATPFGTVYATNITPDSAAGIGAWSYPAFERAMRAGISRDGHHLYPAHPYTSFVKASDADLQALYAYLMAQPPSPLRSRATALTFPFNLRPLMAAWNSLFLSPPVTPADPGRSAAWNRGAELVEGLGHCSACHSPRNLAAAERAGAAHLGGGLADGWHAHALTGRSPAPVAWTATAFYEYLRHGRSPEHGPAAGPMADVIEALAPLPDSDIQAMATYLASLNDRVVLGAISAERALASAASAEPAAALMFPRGARLFQGACAACHSSQTGITPLALNTNLHAAQPDNLLRAVLTGVAAPAISAHPQRVMAEAEVMAMPPFGESLSDPDLVELAGYLRARFAPGRSGWDNIPAALALVRNSGSHP